MINKAEIFELSDKMQMKFLQELSDDMNKLLNDFSFKTFRYKEEIINEFIKPEVIPNGQVVIINDDIEVTKRRRGRPKKVQLPITVSTVV